MLKKNLAVVNVAIKPGEEKKACIGEIVTLDGVPIVQIHPSVYAKEHTYLSEESTILKEKGVIELVKHLDASDRKVYMFYGGKMGYLQNLQI